MIRRIIYWYMCLIDYLWWEIYVPSQGSPSTSAWEYRECYKRDLQYPEETRLMYEIRIREQREKDGFLNEK